MKKTIEAQIQEEIRRRVLAHDEAIRQKEELEMDRDANREALAELTSLTRQNVDQIANQVRDEFAQKRRRKKKIILASVIFLIAIFAYLLLSNRHSFHKPPRRNINFTESFTSNRNKWPTGESYDFKRQFREGRYIFSNASLGYCSWDKIPVKLPSNFEIKLTTTWLEGKYDEYGFMLVNKARKTSFHNIQINGDGSARFSTMQEKKWVTPGDWFESKAHQGDGETANIQHLRVKNDEYEYRINDTVVDRGRFSRTDPIAYFAVRVCGQQTIAFDHLRILAIDVTNQNNIVLDEPFDTAGAGWTPKNKLITRRYFENEQFYYQTNKKNTCFFTGIDIQMTGDYEVRLKSIWKKGEQTSYGLVLGRDFDNFLAFQLQNLGYANYAWYADDKYQKESRIVKSGHTSDGTKANIHRVRVEKGRFQYWVNRNLVFSDAMPDMPIRKIGVRVCGRQTVAFDDLMVRTIN